jgi:hypothetical protein
VIYLTLRRFAKAEDAFAETYLAIDR